MSETITFTVQPEAVIGSAPSFEFCTPAMSTRDILEQATEYLRDHWVSGHWYVYADGVEAPPRIAGVVPEHTVARACSVGAMMLVKQLQGAERLGTDLWEQLCEADPAFFRALVLLVRQITGPRDLWDYGEWLDGPDGRYFSGPEDWAELSSSELIEIITNWNDSDDRLRDEVVNAFGAATKGAIKEEEAGAR